MKLHTEATKQLPELIFQDGKMEIKGRATSHEFNVFGNLLTEYVSDYVLKPEPVTELSIDMEYMNCRSQRYLFDILKKLNDLQQSGKFVVINWFYEPEDDFILELGQMFESLINIPFQFIEKRWDKKNPEIISPDSAAIS